MLNSKDDRVVTFMIRLCCVRPYLNRLEQETPLLALQKYAAMLLRRPIGETMWQWTLDSLHELRVVLNWWPASKWGSQSVTKWILLTTWMIWKILPHSDSWGEGSLVDMLIVDFWSFELRSQQSQVRPAENVRGSDPQKLWGNNVLLQVCLG